MEILKETEKTVIDIEMDMSDDEKKILVEYFDRTIAEKEEESLKINWSIVDILKKQISQGSESHEQ